MSYDDYFYEYKKALLNWKHVFHEFLMIDHKDYDSITDYLKYQFINKGAYYLFFYDNIRFCLYDDHGIAKLEEPFMIQIGETIYHNQYEESLENHIKKGMLLYH